MNLCAFYLNPRTMPEIVRGVAETAGSRRAVRAGQQWVRQQWAGPPDMLK
jgi:hypothetical protein